MTREEFTAAVLSVRAGEPGATLVLWESVRWFVAKSAYCWASNSGGRTSHADLMQTGFLAFMDVLERFDPGRENASFLNLLRRRLSTRFKEESGTRTTKRDALQFAESIEAPALGDEDGVTVSDTIPDKGASLAFTGIEYRDFERYCRNIISAAIDTLPENQATVIRLHYLKGRSLEDIARICGLSSKQAVCDIKERALDRLARGKYRRELRECLETFGDFRAIQDPGPTLSRTETAALANIEKEGATA